MNVNESDLTTLAHKIAKWGYERQICINSTPQAQFVKLVEEQGELAAAIARNKHKDTKDAIGDMFVVLVMISELLHVDIRDCVQLAWEEIKDRKGYLNTDGIFIKEGDTQ